MDSHKSLYEIILNVLSNCTEYDIKYQTDRDIIADNICKEYFNEYEYDSDSGDVMNLEYDPQVYTEAPDKLEKN